jgi:phosphopentomutase
MSIGDFAQQITETYELEDGMSGHWEMRGDGAYQFKYTEYVGIRQATAERFTASLHQMDNNLTLTVERVPQANFE